MGVTSNAFKRQLGRDAGKVVTNVLFGDKHATPIRHVRAQAAKEKHVAELEHQRQLQSQQAAHERKLQRQARKSQNQEDIYRLKQMVEADVLEINNVQFEEGKEEIMSFLRELTSRIEINKWESIIIGKNVKSHSITNHIPSAYLRKFKEALFVLESKHSETKEFELMNKEFKRLKTRKIFGQFKWVFSILAVILAFVILVYTQTH